MFPILLSVSAIGAALLNHERERSEILKEKREGHKKTARRIRRSRSDQLSTLGPRALPLQPGLRQAYKETFYWSTKNPVPIGFRVPKAMPRAADIEAVFESERIKANPELPSRLSTVYVCPIRDSGFCKNKGLYVYRVEVTGAVFTTDGGMWTEAVWRPDISHLYAEDYWRPDSDLRINSAEETLVDGSVVVVAQERGPV